MVGDAEYAVALLIETMRDERLEKAERILAAASFINWSSLETIAVEIEKLNKVAPPLEEELLIPRPGPR